MDSEHSVWREKMVNVEVTASLHGWGHEHGEEQRGAACMLWVPLL
jgi:hypothetical protein